MIFSSFSRVKKFILAVCTLSGATVGVGIFSLPYIASRAGLGLLLAYFLILGLIIIATHYFFGKVALSSPDNLRLPGYAKLYLGNWGRFFAFAAVVFGFFGTLLAYLIVGGEFLANLLSPFFGGSVLFYTLLYFLAGAALIFFDIKAVSQIELLGLVLFFGVLITIFFRGLPFWNLENLLASGGNLSLYFFLPYGPILFSLWGADLIPEAEEMLGKDKHLLSKVIISSILVSSLVYLFFVFSILGLTGALTTPEAISGLGGVFGNGVLSLAFLFGVITTFTSFIALGLTLKKTLWYDFKIPKNLSFLVAVFIPFLLFLLGFKDFIKVIGLVGGIALGIEGILILLMCRKISPRKSFLILPLFLILLIGIIYEILYFAK